MIYKFIKYVWMLYIAFIYTDIKAMTVMQPALQAWRTEEKVYMRVLNVLERFVEDIGDLRFSLYSGVWSYRKNMLCTLHGTPESIEWDIDGDQNYKFDDYFEFVLMDKNSEFFYSTDPIIDEHGEEHIMDRPEAIPLVVSEYKIKVQNSLSRLHRQLLIQLNPVSDNHWLKLLWLKISTSTIECPGCALTAECAVNTIGTCIYYICTQQHNCRYMITILHQIGNMLNDYNPTHSHIFLHDMHQLHALLKVLFQYIVSVSQ